MHEYVLERFRESYEADLVKRKFVLGIETAYVDIDREGVVLLVDQPYPKEKRGDSRLSVVQHELQGVANRKMPGLFDSGAKVAFVFLKDGETFFRSAAEDNYFKARKGLSLKHCSIEDFQRMMALRPEEIFVNERRECIHYYQPESPRLDECLKTYEFSPVRFDYGHINARERFKPHNRESKRLWIIRKESGLEGRVRLSGGILAGEPRL